MVIVNLDLDTTEKRIFNWSSDKYSKYPDEPDHYRDVDTVITNWISLSDNKARKVGTDWALKKHNRFRGIVENIQQKGYDDVDKRVIRKIEEVETYIDLVPIEVSGLSKNVIRAKTQRAIELRRIEVLQIRAEELKEIKDLEELKVKYGITKRASYKRLISRFNVSEEIARRKAEELGLKV